ncbi:hypothetical protein KIPB_013296, partial [Kipferlia bialata]|eukprot:g13296.t1
MDIAYMCRALSIALSDYQTKATLPSTQKLRTLLQLATHVASTTTANATLVLVGGACDVCADVVGLSTIDRSGGGESEYSALLHAALGLLVAVASHPVLVPRVYATHTLTSGLISLLDTLSRLDTAAVLTPPHSVTTEQTLLSNLVCLFAMDEAVRAGLASTLLPITVLDMACTVRHSYTSSLEASDKGAKAWTSVSDKFSVRSGLPCPSFPLLVAAPLALSALCGPRPRCMEGWGVEAVQELAGWVKVASKALGDAAASSVSSLSPADIVGWEQIVSGCLSGVARLTNALTVSVTETPKGRYHATATAVVSKECLPALVKGVSLVHTPRTHNLILTIVYGCLMDLSSLMSNVTAQGVETKLHSWMHEDTVLAPAVKHLVVCLQKGSMGVVPEDILGALLLSDPCPPTMSPSADNAPLPLPTTHTALCLDRLLCLPGPDPMSAACRAVP